jgi:hypothetical protein
MLLISHEGRTHALGAELDPVCGLRPLQPRPAVEHAQINAPSVELPRRESTCAASPPDVLARVVVGVLGTMLSYWLGAWLYHALPDLLPPWIRWPSAVAVALFVGVNVWKGAWEAPSES